MLAVFDREDRLIATIESRLEPEVLNIPKAGRFKLGKVGDALRALGGEPSYDVRVFHRRDECVVALLGDGRSMPARVYREAMP